MSGGLSLDDEDSKLLLNSITVDNVSISTDSLGLDVDDDSTIETLLHNNSSSIDIAEDKSLTLTDAFEVLEEQTMELKGTGGGTLNVVDNITISGTLKLNAQNDIIDGGTLSFNNGFLDLDEDATISSDILLADNASIEIASGKQLDLSQSFEIPENIKLEMVATGGGTLSLGNTLKLTGDLLFSAPYTLENGTLELSKGGLLDVDYDTSIASNIAISDNSTVDIAQGVTLTYTGESIDISSYQLTLRGSGTLSNTKSVLLSNANSLLVLADDIKLALIELTENSASVM